MRLGAPVFCPEGTLAAFLGKLREKNYRAAYCPEYLVSPSQKREIADLKAALSDHDILLAEVGAWCNPLDPDKNAAMKARDFVESRLELAEELGAACCVNIMGSASGAYWYAPDPANFTEAFREDCARLYGDIIDRVKPSRTKMAFEVMPFCFLDNAREYEDFLARLNRPDMAAVHLDLVNLIHDARTLFDQKAIFEDAAARLGNRCVSAHLKDADIEDTPTNVRINEVPMGEGRVDIGHMALCLDGMGADLPVMLEHLPDEAAYDRATRAFTRAARAAGANLLGGFE